MLIFSDHAASYLIEYLQFLPARPPSYHTKKNLKQWKSTTNRLLAGAAAEAGSSLAKACKRKVRDTAEACRQEGFVFSPFAMETLGGFHSGAIAQVKHLAASLARCKGSEEGEVTSQLFGRLSLTLMRANAMMLYPS